MGLRPALVVVTTLALLLAPLGRQPVARAAGEIVVTNTNNSGPGSLRAALGEANTDGIPSTIIFNIPTSDPGFNGRWFTIPVLPLKPGHSGKLEPQTEGATTIDGLSQTGFTGDTNPVGPEIDLDFSATTIGGIAPALSLWSDRNVVRGLTVRGAPNVGVALWGSSNLLEDSYVGTDPTGQVAFANTVGVVVTTRSCAFACAPGETGPFAPATDNVIRGNVISGNGGDGISIQDASRTVVQGNLIGTDASGAHALPNAITPTEQQPFPVGLRIGGRGSLIGGTTPGARNVISGNAGFAGVSLGRGAHASVIQGNLIGTDSTGSAAIPNDRGGILFKISCNDHPDCEPTDNLIGGNTPGAGNVISGNRGNGINLSGIRSQVQGNLIGTDISGSRAVPNSGNGIGFGVQGAGAGNVIGGPAGAGNTIAFNLGAGVAQTVSTDPIRISANAIFANGGLGIDLGADGVTPNDPGDADTGPNGLQNFPVLYMAIPAGENVLVRGAIDSPSPTTITIELFGNDASDPSGYGEGQRFAKTVSPNANGCFTALIRAARAGSYVTATATDAAGNTSEFSAAIPVRAGRPAAVPRCDQPGT